MKRFAAPREAMDKGRFDAFTDGVFAIAITLLVLEIGIIRLDHRATFAQVRYLHRSANVCNLLLLAEAEPR